MVNCQNVDRDSVVGDCEAGSTVCRVPSGNAVGGGEEGEFRERTKSGVLGSETVHSIGAGNGVGRLACVIVSSVVSDSGGECGGNEKSDGGESEAELHDEMSKNSVEGGAGDLGE